MVGRMQLAAVVLAAWMSDAAEPTRLQLALAQAHLLAHRCEMAQAVERLRPVQSELARDADGRVLYVSLLVHLERWPEAVAALALLDGDHSFKAELNRAFVASEVGRADEARAALRRAEPMGDAVLVRSAEAVVLMHEHRDAEAEAVLQRALVDDLTLYGANYNLGVLRVRQGRLLEAAKLIRASWGDGQSDSQKLREDRDVQPLIEAGLLNDLLALPAGGAGVRLPLMARLGRSAQVESSP